MTNINLQEHILDKIIFWLIILLPVTLVSGPFLSDLSISLITLIFIYITINKKLYFYFKNIFSIIFGLFFLFLLLTSFFSLDPIVSLKKTLFYFRFWIFALAVWYIFKLKENELPKKLILTFTIVFIILIFDGFVQFFLKKNLLGWPMQGNRLSSLFGDELILGSYLSRLLPIYFALLVFLNFNKKQIQYFIFFIIFVALEILVFLSGERVAFFYINASTLMLILTMKNFKFFRLLTFFFSIFLIFSIVNFFPETSDRIIKKTIDQIGLSKSNEIFTSDILNTDPNKESKIRIFSIEHQNHYISSYRMFKDNIFTGIGPRMFRYKCGEEKYNLWEGCSTHPHNTYVQLLAETGIFGFLFGIVLFFFIFSSIIKHFYFKIVKDKIIFNDFQLCLLSAILISIWPFVPTGDLFNNWLNIIYFLPVGMFIHTINKN